MEQEKKLKADQEAKAKGEAKRIALAEQEAQKRKQASDAVAERQASLVEKALISTTSGVTTSTNQHVQGKGRQPSRGIEGAFAPRGGGGLTENDQVPKSRHGVALTGIEGFRSPEENRKAREDLALRLERSNPYANPTNPQQIARTFPTLSDAHNSDWQPPPPAPAPEVHQNKDEVFKDMSRPNRIIGHSLGRDINSHVRNVSKAQNAAAMAVKSTHQGKQSSPYARSQEEDRTGFNDMPSSQMPNAAAGTVWAQKEKLTKVCDGSSSIMAPLRLAPKTNLVNLSNNNNNNSNNRNSHTSSSSHKSKQTTSQLRLSSYPPSSSPNTKMEKKSYPSASNSSGMMDNTQNNRQPNNSNINTTSPSTHQNIKQETLTPISSNVLSNAPVVSNIPSDGLVSPPAGWGKKAAKWGDYSDSDSD